MKRASLTAKTATYDVVNGAHVVGLAPSGGSPGYVMFQRSKEGNADDDGIYLEFFHEVASGYNLISHCVITRGDVHVTLREPFAGITAIDVALQIDNREYDDFVRGMKHVFHEKLEQLEIDAQPYRESGK